MNKKDMLKELKEIGTDVDGCIDRFLGNEALYVKFLFKFIEDVNYSRLIEEINKQSTGEAFKCDHTLKGVVANLGLQNIYEALNPIVEDLRTGSIKSELASVDELRQEYEKTIGALRKYV